MMDKHLSLESKVRYEMKEMKTYKEKMDYLESIERQLDDEGLTKPGSDKFLAMVRQEVNNGY